MRIWSALAFAGLIIVCVVNVVVMARRVPPPPRVASNAATNVVLQHEQRFAAVRAALEQRGIREILGYVADVPPGQLESHPRGIEEYFLTQFALAPWVLDAWSEERRWCVANLRAVNVPPRLPPGYQTAHDFGGGVLLLERTTR